VKESQAAVKIIYPCCLKVKTIHLQSSHWRMGKRPPAQILHWTL
jgi:hypothetical protein